MMGGNLLSPFILMFSYYCLIDKIYALLIARQGIKKGTEQGTYQETMEGAIQLAKQGT
jgi:hypothetical protein